MINFSMYYMAMYKIRAGDRPVGLGVASYSRRKGTRLAAYFFDHSSSPQTRTSLEEPLHLSDNRPFSPQDCAPGQLHIETQHVALEQAILAEHADILTQNLRFQPSSLFHKFKMWCPHGLRDVNTMAAVANEFLQWNDVVPIRAVVCGAPGAGAALMNAVSAFFKVEVITLKSVVTEFLDREQKHWETRVENFQKRVEIIAAATEARSLAAQSLAGGASKSGESVDGGDAQTVTGTDVGDKSGVSEENEEKPPQPCELATKVKAAWNGETLDDVKVLGRVDCFVPGVERCPSLFVFRGCC